MTDRIEFSVGPARNRAECLEKFGALSKAMAVGHALALKRAADLPAWNEETKKAREWAFADAREILEGQMQLAQVELFIHNLPDEPLSKPEGQT